MQTNLETLGQLERRLNVSLPVSEIDAEVQKRLQRLAKTMKMPGFRPGKVPMKIVAQQYGPQVRSDVISDRVQSSFSDAVREQNLRVAGYPRIEPKAAAAEGAPADGPTLDYSAVFEVYPEVTLADLSQEEIRRPVAEVTAADVDRTIETLRRQRVRFEPVDRAAQTGDRLTIDFTGRIDGVEFPGGQAVDFPIVLGEGRMLPEFESSLPGTRAGDRRSFELEFPADYHGKEVAGKRAQFEVTVKRVERPLLPDLDEAFARSLGIASGDLDEMRREIEGNLRLELRRKIDARIKEQVMTALRRGSKLAVPRALVDIEMQNLAQRTYNELRSNGAKPEDIKLDPEMFRPQAEERVALGLIIGEVIRVHGLSASPEQVRALVEDTAQTYEQPSEVVKWHYSKPERLRDFEVLALESNVVKWALERAKVVDDTVTFEALMNPPAAPRVQA